MNQKQGYKTTEFWLTAIVNIVAVVVIYLQTTGKITGEDGQRIVDTTNSLISDLSGPVALIAMAIANAMYGKGRSDIKKINNNE